LVFHPWWNSYIGKRCDGKTWDGEIELFSYDKNLKNQNTCPVYFCVLKVFLKKIESFKNLALFVFAF